MNPKTERYDLRILSILIILKPILKGLYKQVKVQESLLEGDISGFEIAIYFVF